MKKVLFVLVFMFIPSGVLANDFPGGWLPRVQVVRESTRIKQEKVCVGDQCKGPEVKKSVLVESGAPRVKRVWARVRFWR